MRNAKWLPVVAMLLLAGLPGQAGPVGGPFARSKQRVWQADRGASELEFTTTFEGGRRACVFARGDHNPPVALELAVYDAMGKLVARDERALDFPVVFWVPPRDGDYRVVLRNLGKEEYARYPEDEKFTDVYISVR